MAASLILAAKGARLHRFNGATYDAIPQCRVLNSPEINRDYLDGSNHDSPGSFREWIPGFIDGGDLPLEIVWNPAITLHVSIYNDALAGTLITWRVIMNNASSSTWQFTGYVSKFGVPLPFDGLVLANMGIKVTALPVLTP